MLYLIGLGLNVNGISKEGLIALQNCKKIYLESYTVNFPYSTNELEKALGKDIVELGRSEVESEKLIEEAKKNNVALLIYGCPLFATTHLSLIIDAKKAKVGVGVIYSASVFDAIASCGLQLYKFGKITSMPKWQKNYSPDSFLDIVRENLSSKAHSLILTDIGLDFENAIMQLKEAAKKKEISLDKIVVCTALGTEKGKFFYSTIEEIMKKHKKKIVMPFCLIIPGEMHFLEKEALESLSE
jgi:diphthine synthase